MARAQGCNGSVGPRWNGNVASGKPWRRCAILVSGRNGEPFLGNGNGEPLLGIRATASQLTAPGMRCAPSRAAGCMDKPTIGQARDGGQGPETLGPSVGHLRGRIQGRFQAGRKAGRVPAKSGSSPKAETFRAAPPPLEQDHTATSSARRKTSPGQCIITG